MRAAAPALAATPHVSPRVQALIEAFVTQLRRRQIYGSHAVSEKMLDILRTVISTGKWGNVAVLIDLIKHVGRRCQDAQPMELCVGNTVRRLLSVIREECAQLAGPSGDDGANGDAAAAAAAAADGDTAPLASPTHQHHGGHHHHHHHHHHVPKPSVFSLFPDPEGDLRVDYTRIGSHATKALFVEAVNEMIDELRNLHESIAQQALAHIHAGEVILTAGDSLTAEHFFRHAASKKRAFHVLVAESAPMYAGQRLASKLAAVPGIDVTVISDAAAFAVMPRVNKVVLGTHAVLANGGLVAVAGASTLAAAAKHYGVPVVVVAGVYKLTPAHPFDLDVFNVMAAPSSVAEYADDDLARECEVTAPTCDYVAPELVSLFVTNEGAYPSSYIYRLLTESYHPDDVSLEPTPGAFDKYWAKTEKRVAETSKGGDKGGSSKAAVARRRESPVAGEDKE